MFGQSLASADVSLVGPIVSTVLSFAAGYLAAESTIGGWDAMTRRYLGELQPMLMSLKFNEAKIRTGLRWWGAMLAGNLIFVGILGRMLPIAIAILVLLMLAPRIVVAELIARRRRLLRDQLVAATTALAAASRAGLSLAQGLESVHRETPEPLASEFRIILNEYDHGRTLREAIVDARRRLDLDSFTLFTSAILVSLERGGRITEALERIGHSLKENQRVERRLEAETASGRRVVWILAACPALFLVGFYAMNPSGTAMVFQTLIGQFVMLCVIGLVATSLWWSHKILSLEV